MWAVRVGVRESCHALRLVGLVFLDTKASCDSSKAIRRCHDALNSKPKVFRAEQTTDSYSWEALSTRPCSVRSALYVYVGCLLEREIVIVFTTKRMTDPQTHQTTLLSIINKDPFQMNNRVLQTG